MTDYIDAYFSFMMSVLLHGPLAYFIIAGVVLVLSEGIFLGIARYRGEDDNVMIVFPMFGLFIASLAWAWVIMMAPIWLIGMSMLWVVLELLSCVVSLLFKGVDKLKAHNEAKALAEKKEAKRLRDIERRGKFDERQRSAGTVE